MTCLGCELANQRMHPVHVIDEAVCLTETISRVSAVIDKLFKPDGITVCQNGGVFNDLGHFHIHVVPRTKSLSFEHSYSLNPLNNSHLKAKLAHTCELIRSKI